MDRFWIAKQFDRKEIWEMFGLQGHGALDFRTLCHRSKVIQGVIRCAWDNRRIGFVTVFPPWEDVPHWEFGYAIARRDDRNAFSAIHAMDASAHYLLDYLRIPGVYGRTRADNHSARAILKRVGYQETESRMVDSHRFSFFLLDQRAWSCRREKLERGEHVHPSGLGGVFATLRGPPYVPQVFAGPPHDGRSPREQL
jgi:RimJ/RimL family protein N-acetyltransferase